MSFNPNLRKQTQEVVFSTKKVKATHPLVFFSISMNLQLGIKKQKRYSPGIKTLEDGWDNIKNY